MKRNKKPYYLSPYKVARPSPKTHDNASLSDSYLIGRTPTTQEGHGARQDDSWTTKQRPSGRSQKGTRAKTMFHIGKPNTRFSGKTLSLISDLPFWASHETLYLRGASSGLNF